MVDEAVGQGLLGAEPAVAVAVLVDLLDGLAGITAPTLVIAGAEDPATPPWHAERIAEGVRGARVEVLSPAAHLANAEQPGAVNRLLLEHFGGAA